MQVVVDGIIFELNPRGGVARIYQEILRRMGDLEPMLQIHLLSNRRGYEIGHPSIAPLMLVPPFERLLRPRRILGGVSTFAANGVKRRVTRRLNTNIWHPTYYTWLEGWRGPQIFTVYDMLYERYEHLFNEFEDRFYRRQKRECLQRADRVLCISRTTAEDVQTYLGIKADKIRVIPLGVSSAFHTLTETGDQSAQTPYFLYVGGRRRYKNFDGALLAFSRWERRQDVSLLVVGADFSAAERRKIAALGLSRCVRLMRDVSDLRLQALYNRAAGLIYPSLYEGFGIPLLEAAMCGCPVIASRIPSTCELLGDIPIYFDATDTDAMIDAFETGLSEGRQSERTTRGLRKAAEFSWDKTARQTLDVYHEVAE